MTGDEPIPERKEQKMEKIAGPSTRSVHTPRFLDDATGAIVPPVIENVAYALKNAEDSP